MISNHELSDFSHFNPIIQSTNCTLNYVLANSLALQFVAGGNSVPEHEVSLDRCSSRRNDYATDLGFLILDPYVIVATQLSWNIAHGIRNSVNCVADPVCYRFNV